MELWDLYNSEREKTGVMHQRGLPIPKGYYHLCVSIWLFPCDAETGDLHLQETEVAAAKWADREEIQKLYDQRKLHPLIDYIDEIAAWKYTEVW